MQNKQQQFGERSETLAAWYLKKNGYKIIEQNYRNQLGEIDIIARDKKTIVFVEVKTRFGSTIDAALAAVDQVKQARLTKLALAYLQKNGLLEHAARFDVVAVAWPEQGEPLVQHVENAFPAVGDWQMFS